MNNTLVVLLNQIIENEISGICKDYKISSNEAKEIITNIFNNNLSLQTKLEEKDEYNFDKVKKFKEYKEFIKKVKKEIYYYLRKYHSNLDEEQKIITLIEKEGSKEKLLNLFEKLEKLHISSKERIKSKLFWQKTVKKHINEKSTILDLGCALDPILFHDIEYKSYVAVDKDRNTSNILTLYKKKFNLENLEIVCQDLENFDAEECCPATETEYDMVIMFKLLPLLHRQNMDLFKKLATISSKRMLVTGSKQSMTKHKTIEKRERKVLDEFVKLTGKQVIEEINTDEEFGLLLS